MDQPPTRIAIFRAGTHTAMSGMSRDYTREDLAACAAAYDPALFEAPVVVGHPVTNAPAYGWVRRLAVEGEVLYAELDQVDPAFVEAVRAGRYKKISAAFYLPEAPTNPAPGALYLRHVGFLGGQAPAVKGLPAVSFAAGEFEELAVYGCATSLTQYGQDARSTEENTMSEQDQAAFAEAVKQRDALAAEVDGLKAETQRLKAEADERERRARHQEHATFCQAQVAAGRIPSGAAAVFVVALDALAEAGEVQFAEGKTVLSAFRETVAALPPLVDTQEKAGGAAKTQMARGEFEALPPEQRMAAVKAGVTLS